jgi:hypothetical protein
MSLASIMIEQLGMTRRVVENGEEVVPRWRIATVGGDFLVLTGFDTDKPEQRRRALSLIKRFMIWKMATSYVLTAETWLGAAVAHPADEALLSVGVSHYERLAVFQRIQRTEAVRFDDPVWLSPHRVEKQYLDLLPYGRTEISTEDEAELTTLFGRNGELRAERLT